MNTKPLPNITTPGIDKRLWPMMAVVAFLGVIIIKEITLPPAVILVIGGLGLLGLFMTSLQTPAIALYMLVAYLPFSRLLTGDFGTNAYALNLTNILTILVFIGYSMHSSGKKEEKTSSSSPFNGLVWLFCLMGTVSLIRAGAQYGSWYFWELITPLKRWLTPVLFYFLALWVVRDKKTLKTVVALIMVATAIVAVMAIRDYQYVDDSDFETSRVGGIAEHSNTLGAFFVYYMFLFLGFFLIYSKKPKAWLLLIPFALCFRGIMVTFSRGAYLAFAAGSMTALFFRSRGTLVGLVLAAGLMVMHPALMPAGIRYRMGMTMQKDLSTTLPGEDITESLESSAAVRVEIWRGAVQMIKDNPIWGVGYGAFPYYIPRYTQGQVGTMDAHNSYLLIAAEMGIPTLLVFLLVLGSAFYYTYWLYRRTTDETHKAIALGFLSGLVGLVAANMFGSRMDDQAVSSYFWILCGLIIRAVLMEKEAARAPQGQVLQSHNPSVRRAVGPLPAAEYDRLRARMRRRR